MQCRVRRGLVEHQLIREGERQRQRPRERGRRFRDLRQRPREHERETHEGRWKERLDRGVQPDRRVGSVDADRRQRIRAAGAADEEERTAELRIDRERHAE